VAWNALVKNNNGSLIMKASLEFFSTRVVGFIICLLCSTWLLAEEPEQALDRITSEVIAENGSPNSTLINQRFLEWLATTNLASSSGELTNTGNCGVSGAACNLPTEGQNLDFPGVRNLRIKTRGNGTVGSTFSVKWRRPMRLPRDLRNTYELTAYDVYLVREDGTFERFRLDRRLNRNGKFRPPRKIKLRNRVEAEYHINVRAIYNLIDQNNSSSVATKTSNGLNTNSLNTNSPSNNTRSGPGGGIGSGWSGGGITSNRGNIDDVGDLPDASNPSIDSDLLACIQSQYSDSVLIENLLSLSCIQQDIASVEGLEHLSALRTLFLGNSNSQASDANTFSDLSVIDFIRTKLCQS